MLIFRKVSSKQEVLSMLFLLYKILISQKLFSFVCLNKHFLKITTSMEFLPAIVSKYILYLFMYQTFSTMCKSVFSCIHLVL